MRLSLRLFKNRELVQVHDLQQQWNSGRWWEEVSGTLHKATDNAFAKYEGYDVQELHIETADKRFQYTPAKACILWRIHPHEHIDGADRGDGVDEVDAAIKQHNATMYETVQAHPPVSPLSIGGHRVVPCSLNASPHQADIRNLSNTVWKQLGQTGDPTILLLKLKKQRLSVKEVTVAKDDVTGDVYPYRITRVLYLTRQDRTKHNTNTSDVDVDRGDDEPVVGWGVKGVDDGQGGQDDAPHDIATLLAQGFLQRPSAQGMTKPLFLQGLQHNTLWPGYLSTYSPSTPWKPSLSNVFDTCAEMAQPVTGTQEFLFPFGAITCTAIQTPPPHPSITVHILKIATLKGVRDSVGIACRQTLDRWISKHTFETAEFHICSIGSTQWMDFLLKTGWAPVTDERSTVFLQVRRSSLS